MDNKPVRPKFEREYLERKAAEQQRQVNGTQKVNETVIEPVKIEERQGKKKMELWMKILLSVCGVACVGAVAYGIATFQTAKENEVQQATSVIQIQAGDTTNKNEVEETVDKTLEYQDEAEELWSENGDLFSCDKYTFVEKYVNYRTDGLSKEQSYESLYNEFAKENQINTNEQGEVVAEQSEMDAVINSTDEDTTEEVVEQPEEVITEQPEEVIADYVVENIEATTLYAIQNVNLRKGPDAKEFEKVGGLSAREQVTVVGIVKQYKGETILWYQLDSGEFVSGAYLVEKLPAEQPQTPSNNNGGTNNTQPAPTQPSSGNGNPGGFKIPGGGSTQPLNGAGGGQATTDAGGAAGGTNIQ